MSMGLGILIFTFAAATSFAICKIILASANEPKLLKSLISIPASKTDHEAYLLGGLAIFFGSATCIYFYSEMFLIWLVPAILLSITGYLDDRYELKPRVKVFIQFFSALLFSYMMTMHFQASLGFFSVVFCWSLCTFNGSNLLDGIDTFSVKYYTVSLFVMAGIGFSLGYEELGYLSVSLIAPVLSFYFFNRFPSKLHLGEVGGTVLGLNTIFLALILYSNLKVHTAPVGEDHFSLLFSVLSFVHLPLVELGVSFLRRLFSSQKPFHGDRLHIHYLLADRLEDVSKAASLLAVFHLQALCLNIALTYFVNSTVAFWLTGMFYVSYYIDVGLPSWVAAAQDSKKLTLIQGGAIVTAEPREVSMDDDNTVESLDDVEERTNKVA